MTAAHVTLDDVHVAYGSQEVLRGVSLTLEPGTICGLLGRNGAGKSTLMSLLASHLPPRHGRVLIDGADPFEDTERMAAVALVGGDVEGGSAYRVGDALDLAALLRPGWDEACAARLVDLFGLSRKGSIGELSRGQRSAVAAVLGLASRAPLTLLDEVHLGMDAPTRYAFYDQLLIEHAAHPRTVVMATHHIDEVASLFGRVAILDGGRILVDDDADALRGRGTEVTGPIAAVEGFVAGRTVLSHRDLGPTRAAVVWGELADADRATATAAGLDLGPIPLQDLFVHLTTPTEQEVPS